MKRRLVLIASAVGTIAQAQVQKAQPPPEFRSDYVVPHAPAPLPRAEIWQAIDVAVLVLVLALGARAVLTRRSRVEVRLLTLFSVAYFGFYKLGCVCSIGSIQNVAYAVTHPNYALPWTVAAFFLIPLATALFIGRVFCGTACPMGAVQDLVLVKPLKVPGWISGPLGTIPYLYLGTAVLYASLGSAFLICEVDPYVTFFRLNGPLTVVVFGAILLVVSLFVGRPYCRFLCPYGVLLRWASLVSKWRVTISPAECVNCHLCADACPYGAIEPPTPTVPRSRKLTAIQLAFVPILVAIFAIDGYRLAPTLASYDNRVQLGIELEAQRHDPLLKRADSLRTQGKGPVDAVLVARQVQANFRTGATWLGGWFGLVIALRVLGLARRARREEYEVESGACVSCARCYAACPVVNRARFGHLSNLVGGAE